MTASSPFGSWSFRLTKAGHRWLVAASGLLAIGLFKNINLLALLGWFMLVAGAFNIVLAGRRLTTLSVRRRRGEPIFAGQRCSVEATVAAGGRARLGVRLEDSGPAHKLKWRAARLGGPTGQTFRGEIVLPHRGLYDWGPLFATSGYPFGLAERRVQLAPSEPVLVLPRLGTLYRGAFRRHLRGGDLHREQIGRRAPHPAAQGEVHGLRSFRTGDSPRTIHWRTSARRGELMVREFEDLPGDSMLLVLDPGAPNTPDAAVQFEGAVSLAATLAWEWCRAGTDRLVLALAGPEPVLLEGVSGLVHGLRALAALARATPRGDTTALLARLAALGNPPATTVVVSVGPGDLAIPLRRRLRRPVTCIDSTDSACLDFYKPPSPSAGAEPEALDAAIQGAS